MRAVKYYREMVQSVRYRLPGVAASAAILIPPLPVVTVRILIPTPLRLLVLPPAVLLPTSVSVPRIMSGASLC